jgi:2-dehydropantoate 2-reductase
MLAQRQKPLNTPRGGQACGFSSSEREQRADISAAGSRSMYRDLQREKRVEADHILGDPLARARRLAVPPPLLAAAFANLRIYQRGLSSR